MVAVLGPALVLCVVGARIWSGPVSAVLLAVVSGALWGLFAVLTKGVVDRLDGRAGIWALLRTPELYAWALVAVAGTAWQQSSFRAGSLTASLPTMTVTEPVVGVGARVVVLGETLRPGRRRLVRSCRGRRRHGGRDRGAGPWRGGRGRRPTTGRSARPTSLVAC